IVNYVVGLKVHGVKKIRADAQRHGSRAAECWNQCSGRGITSHSARTDWCSADARRQPGNGLDRIESGAQLVAFVREKEKCLILYDRAAERAAKLVKPQFTLLSDDIVKKVGCIELVISQV